MHLQTAHLVGFRNFSNCTINFNEKSLIIGPNDIGKSNLLWALRLLLDRKVSEMDLEPSDSDFYAHSETTQLSITLKFAEADLDCIRSKFKENVSAANEIFIRYEATKSPNSGEKSYKILVGPTPSNLVERDGRFYLRVLNLSYIDSTRDLQSFIRREKRHLLQRAREGRSAEEIVEDETKLAQISTHLDNANTQISELNYIARATQELNDELKELSVTNSNLRVEFDTGAADTKHFVENLHLTSKYDSKTVALGGDGRNNQVYLAMWSAQHSQDDEQISEVTINCIEEPEAHLHPHQQRRLSKYLTEKLKGQVILTSHSPQIACEFRQNSIINLVNNCPDTQAALNGCSEQLADDLINFGHRLNVIRAEAFFSTVALLVEGTSEVLFYKTLAKELDLDLDRYNVSIVSVEGVGFSAYRSLYESLGVSTVMRTDFDINKVPRKKYFRAAGIQRLIESYQRGQQKSAAIDSLIKRLGDQHKRLPARAISEEILPLWTSLRSELKSVGIFISDLDLEWDLINSPVRSSLHEYYETETDEELHEVMCERKSDNIFRFLSEYSESLKTLSDSSLAEPLRLCVTISASGFDDAN